MNPSALPNIPARRAAPAGLLPSRGTSPAYGPAKSGVVPDAVRPCGAAAKLVHHRASTALGAEVATTACPQATSQLPGASVPGPFEFGT